MRRRWALWVAAWCVPGFYRVPSPFYQKCFIQVQQEVLTTEQSPLCLAGALSNLRSRERWFFLEALVSVVAPAGSSEVLDTFLIVCQLVVTPAQGKSLLPKLVPSLGPTLPGIELDYMYN